MKNNLIARHPLIWCYVFFLYFSVVPQILIYSSGSSGFVGLRQSILVSFLWLIPILIWPQKTKKIAAVVGIFLWVGGISSLGYFLIYGQEFSQSVIFIIFESNFTESSEFLKSYFKYSHLLYFALFTLIPVLMWRLITPVNMNKKYHYALAATFSLMIAWPFIDSYVIKSNPLEQANRDLLKDLQPASPWNLAVGYIQYRSQLADVQKNLADIAKIKPLRNFSQIDADSAKTLVLVIGESTNRQRMGLYGYARDTTPNLSAMKKRNELLVFNDVITPRPYTIEALQQVLSFADTKDPDAYLAKPTLLTMMKQAGYEITWITNQQTQTHRNTLLTTLSQLADHQVYLNNSRAQNSDNYDGAVLKPFAKTLTKNSSGKKLIVVHLLGTHRIYDYRYPQAFKKFTNAEQVPEWVTLDHIEEYNGYDNSILYNDYVVSELIKTLDKQQEQSLLVYLSDHGEEVYDYPNVLFCGRNEGNPSPAMYTVPFIVWSNVAFQKKNANGKWKQYTNRPYSSSDFIYTWSDMAGLNYKEMDLSRSLVSEKFKQRPRLIGNPDVSKSIQTYTSFKRQFEHNNPLKKYEVTAEEKKLNNNDI